jgi:hypothetical protein
VSATTVGDAFLPVERRQDTSATRTYAPTLTLTADDAQFAERADPLRTVTFYAALALAVVKFASLAEVQAYLTGFRGYLLYIFGAPAALGLVVAGGFQRAFTGRPAWYWIGFCLWMFACIPFSSWRGGAFAMAVNYPRDVLLIMFCIAGLVVSWRDCRVLATWLAAAAAFDVMMGRVFAYTSEGRLELGFGTISNSNDYAAVLLLMLPFLLLFISNSKHFVARAGALLAFAYGVLLILRTGSRGGLTGLVVCALFLFLRGSGLQRVLVVATAFVGVLAIPLLLPADTLQRILSFSSSEQGASQEALESSDARRYVLRKGIEYTLEFPIFGVGPGQFPMYEGTHNKVLGNHGLWHSTHCTWIQASAECGIPGALFMLAGYISSFLMLNRTYRKAKRRPDCRDIQNTAFFMMLGMLGFCLAISFLNFAYSFYGPALAGLAIAVHRAANYEFEHRGNGFRIDQPVFSFGPPLYPAVATLHSRRRKLYCQF